MYTCRLSIFLPVSVLYDVSTDFFSAPGELISWWLIGLMTVGQDMLLRMTQHMTSSATRTPQTARKMVTLDMVPGI